MENKEDQPWHKREMPWWQVPLGFYCLGFAFNFVKFSWFYAEEYGGWKYLFFGFVREGLRALAWPWTY